ncbi:hypothetical protein, partial [Salmonella enterica]|uniref:hypothetical protein n=1 Tax=Salmonella enterica TaxID=28901 RepID=UPI003965CAC9
DAPNVFASPAAVFPAPAGINRRPECVCLARCRVPRASGDKPWIICILRKWARCSPRQRG